MPTTVDITTKLSNLLPTGTFLTFQVIAPLATNNGSCGATEMALTVATLALLAVGCIATSYTDSYEAPNGQVYTGVVTTKGLWLPGFERTDDTSEIKKPVKEEKTVATAVEKESIDPNVDIKTHLISCTCFQCTGVQRGSSVVDQERYSPKWNDFAHASLSVITFLTLTIFTSPVSTCFYPHISESLLKTLPLLVALVLGSYCSFSPKVRHGIGFALPTTKTPTTKTPITKTPTTKTPTTKTPTNRTNKTSEDDNNTAKTKNGAGRDELAVYIHPELSKN